VLRILVAGQRQSLDQRDHAARRLAGQQSIHQLFLAYRKLQVRGIFLNLVQRFSHRSTSFAVSYLQL
jgi:hypothetical protein